MMLSGVLMLRHLGERDAADRLEGAIAERDHARARTSRTTSSPTATTRRPSARSQIADAVIEEMNA